VAGELIGSEPADPPFAGPERAVLEGWLEYHRAILLLMCERLDDEHRKRRPVPTSLMSLHGMVRHMADVERNWSGCAFGPPDLPAIFRTEQARDADWAPLDGADWSADLAVWQAECEQSRLTAAAYGDPGVVQAVRGGERAEFSLRCGCVTMRKHSRNTHGTTHILHFVTPPNARLGTGSGR
jgi:hypothetical protein